MRVEITGNDQIVGKDAQRLEHDFIDDAIKAWDAQEGHLGCYEDFLRYYIAMRWQRLNQGLN